jgi:hypothetical protein
VLQEIVQKDKMHMLAILESVDAAKVPGILDKIQQNLHTLYLDGIPMTGSQAYIIFERIDNNYLADLTVHFRKDYWQGFVRALVGFIQNSSSVYNLMLTLDDDDDWVAEETFHSLCDAILSSSVDILSLGRLRVRGHKSRQNSQDPRLESILLMHRPLFCQEIFQFNCFLVLSVSNFCYL